MTMELTVYGNNASCPDKDGACSCYLLEADGKKILIDMGNGCLAKLQQQVDLSELDAIIISHLHFDHFGDLFCAKYRLETRKAYGENIGRKPVLVPALPAWAFEELSTNDVFDIVCIRDGMNYSFPDCSARISFIKVKHMIESYGLRVASGKKTFAYSGDSGFCPQLKSIAYKSDLFLCESTYLSGLSGEHSEEDHHLSARDAAVISLESGAKKLVLTHFHQPDAEKLQSEAREIFANAESSKIFGKYEI